MLRQKKLSKKDQAELLRRTVDTVGKVGAEGEQIQNVISVGMLSEGWDAKTVTHIMGLRAFTSQLLCEQVVGRGLRRTSYEVNPETSSAGARNMSTSSACLSPSCRTKAAKGLPPPPPSPKTEVSLSASALRFEITWPNVVRIDYEYRPKLTLDLASVPVLQLDASATPTVADLAPIVEGKPDIKRISTIDLEELGKRFRMQRIVFEAARDVYDQVQPTWKGSREVLLAQVIRWSKSSSAATAFRSRLLFSIRMASPSDHAHGEHDEDRPAHLRAHPFENVQGRNLVFDREHPHAAPATCARGTRAAL